MQTTEAAQHAAGLRSFLLRLKSPPTVEEIRGPLVRGWQAAWGEMRTNRPLRMAIFAWFTSWIVLQSIFVACVHYSFEGESYRAFRSTLYRGVPDRLIAAGQRPVCVEDGYDGTFYYHISNDVFGRFDTYKHMDEVLYRYQRICIPMLAGGLASLLGFEITPGLLYHTVQFGITTAGFGVLVYWLLIKKLPSAFALTWLLATGTLQSLWWGLLDAPADAFFIFAMAALFARRLWLYVPAAILLLLTREMYCLFAFAVFSLSAFTRVAWQDADGGFHPIRGIDWQDVRGYWQRVVLTALPGAVMLSWTAYLMIHFLPKAFAFDHKSPFSARGNPTLTGWPFQMMFKHLARFYATANVFEFRLAVVSAFTLLLLLALFARGYRRFPLALLCTVPYVLMTTMLGAAIWEDHGSHMRVIDTALVIIGLFMLPFDKSLLLRFMLILQGIVGVSVNADLRVLNPTLNSPYLVHEKHGYYQPNPAGSPENPVLNDLGSSVEWVDNQSVIQRNYHGLWDFAHREVKPVTVAVTNLTDVAWQPGLGKHPIWLGYHLYNGSGERELAKHSVLLDKPIEPGETKEFTVYLELRRPRDYTVEFSVWQDGPGWFVRTDPEFGKRYRFTVE